MPWLAAAVAGPGQGPGSGRRLSVQPLSGQSAGGRDAERAPHRGALLCRPGEADRVRLVGGHGSPRPASPPPQPLGASGDVPPGEGATPLRGKRHRLGAPAVPLRTRASLRCFGLPVVVNARSSHLMHTGAEMALQGLLMLFDVVFL